MISRARVAMQMLDMNMLQAISMLNQAPTLQLPQIKVMLNSLATTLLCRVVVFFTQSAPGEFWSLSVLPHNMSPVLCMSAAVIPVTGSVVCLHLPGLI